MSTRRAPSTVHDPFDDSSESTYDKHDPYESSAVEHTENFEGTDERTEESSISEQETAQRGWANGLGNFMWNAYDKLLTVATGRKGQSTEASDDEPAPQPEPPKAVPDKKEKPRNEEKCQVMQAIQEYTNIVKEGLDPDADDVPGLIGREQASLRSAQHAIFNYLQDQMISKKIWKAAHGCPYVWIMVTIIKEAGVDKLTHLTADIQKSVDAKLDHPDQTGGDCAMESGRDDNLTLLDKCFAMKSIRISPEMKEKLMHLGAEWEQLLLEHSHVHDELPSNCTEVLAETYLHPVVLIVAVIFMIAEIATAALHVVDLRLEGNLAWSNYSGLVYLAGGFIEFIILSTLYSEMKEANAKSLPILPMHWLKAVPVLPVLEANIAWQYIRTVWYPADYPIETDKQIVLWDMRQLFHLSRQLHAMFVSFPFALFGAYIHQHQLKEGEYSDGYLLLAVHLAMLNVARALLAALWNLFIQKNSTVWGMKRTFSYPAYEPPRRIVRFTLVILVYYLTYHTFVLVTGIGHNDCGTKYAFWLGGELLLTCCLFVICLLINRRGLEFTTSIKWLLLPLVTRVVLLILGYRWMYVNDVKHCMKTNEYALASLILDFSSFVFVTGLLLYYLIVGKCFTEEKEDEEGSAPSDIEMGEKQIADESTQTPANDDATEEDATTVTATETATATATAATAVEPEK